MSNRCYVRDSQAARRTLHAARAVVDGRMADSVTAYLDAARRWRELGVDFDLALSQMDFALMQPDEPTAKAAGDEARTILGRLGATTLLGRLDRMPATEPPVRVVVGSAPTEPQTVDSNRRSG